MAKIIPEGLGIWLWELKNCDGGDIHKILERCKSSGIKWIAIKSGDAVVNPGFDNAIAVILDLFHANAIKVYTWNYSKPSTWQKEVQQISTLVKMGVDGHVIDAEMEWQVAHNNRTEAVEFLTTLRSAIGDTFIAHSPFAVVNYHGTFPYAEFGQFCDAAMPQAYWTEFDWDVTKTISMMNSSWNLFNLHNPKSAKPVWPIGVTYGSGYPGVPGHLNQNDIAKFLRSYPGMPVSVYSYDAASTHFPETFATLANLNQNPDPTPIVVPDTVPDTIPMPTKPQVEELPVSQVVQQIATYRSIGSYLFSFLKLLFHIKR